MFFYMVSPLTDMIVGYICIKHSVCYMVSPLTDIGVGYICIEHAVLLVEGYLDKMM